MSEQTKQWTLRLYADEVYHHRVVLHVPDGAKLQSVRAAVDYVVPPSYRVDATASPFASIDRGVQRYAVLMPWSDVEQIAAWVRGDGTDPQRQALADGILEGRHGKGKDEP